MSAGHGRLSYAAIYSLPLAGAGWGEGMDALTPHPNLPRKGGGKKNVPARILCAADKKTRRLPRPRRSGTIGAWLAPCCPGAADQREGDARYALPVADVRLGGRWHRLAPLALARPAGGPAGAALDRHLGRLAVPGAGGV